MTHHSGGLHPGRLPHRRQRHHHREQHRLDDIDPVEPVPAQLLQQIPIHKLRQRVRALPHPLREHRRISQEFTRHPGPLRTLTREHEHRTPRASHRTPRDGSTRSEALKPGDQFLAVAPEDDAPVLEPRAGRRQGPGHVGRFAFGGGQEVFAQTVRLGPQGLGGLRGEGDRYRARHDGGRLGLRSGRRFVGGRCLLDDDVGVGAADAEGGDARATGAAVRALGPLPGFREEFDGARRPVDLGGRLVHVEGGRQDAVAHGQDHLHEARDARGGLGVADVGLDGPQPQGFAAFGALLSVGGEEGLGLDGVAEGGAGAVRLDRVDVGGREAGVGEGLHDDALLGGAVGGGQAVAGAVLVDGGAAYDREDGAAGTARVGEALDEEHADALAPAGAVGGGRERLAAAVGGEALLAAELGEDAGRGDDGDARDESHAALALAQRLHGQVQGDQGGGAGRVDGEGGAFEAEGVGDAAGFDGGRVAGAHIAFDVLLGFEEERGVVLAVGADEHAGAAAAYRRGVDARTFEGLPRGLQEEPLLRVHRQGLARGNPEECRVEFGDPVQESAVGRGTGALLSGGVRVVERLQIPVAVGGQPRNGVAALGEQPPQVFRAAHAAGEAAAHRGNRDGLLRSGLDVLQTLLRLMQVRRNPLEIVAQRLFIRHQMSPVQDVCRTCWHTTDLSAAVFSMTL
ncbi:hypothetical protein GCM10010245_80130 [Streptomyces spectabilis]|nr:hypothetical protein GCM10010245_80130 [Streptomyces spectabilis]